MSIEISSVFPRTKKERDRFYVVIILAINFVTFLTHGAIDKTIAFPTGGRLVGGFYLVSIHGNDVLLPPSRFWFNYIHGIIFVIVHTTCCVAIWKLRKKNNPQRGIETS